MLMLRGPQTLNELQTRTDRMANFADADAVRQELDLLIGRRPPLVKEIGRAPGQREDRFAHLLAGDVDASAIARAKRAARYRFGHFGAGSSCGETGRTGGRVAGAAENPDRIDACPRPSKAKAASFRKRPVFRPQS